ncbi:MAG: AAC(3) family N-acetyltransferase [Muribaculaceae bacterium]
MLNIETIQNDLKAIGVTEGDTLLLRISYRAVGKIDGGVASLIEALLKAVGSDGTIVAMAFPMPTGSVLFKPFYRFNPIKGGSIAVGTGAVPSVMAKHKNVFFSSNLLFPYVAIGKNAKIICENHTEKSKPYDLIENIANKFNAKILRIGGNVLNGTTHIAFSEALKQKGAYQKRYGIGNYYLINGKSVWKQINVSMFCYKQYSSFSSQYLVDCELGRGKVGNGNAVLNRLRDILVIEKKLITPNPKILLCDNPYCWKCRLSYSYSDSNLIKFSFNVIIGVLNKRISIKDGLSILKSAFKNILFGIKTQ